MRRNAARVHTIAVFEHVNPLPLPERGLTAHYRNGKRDSGRGWTRFSTRPGWRVTTASQAATIRTDMQGSKNISCDESTRAVLPMAITASEIPASRHRHTAPRRRKRRIMPSAATRVMAHAKAALTSRPSRSNSWTTRLRRPSRVLRTTQLPRPRPTPRAFHSPKVRR